MPEQDIETRRFQCRHIFTDGHRCGSPCLRNEHFCYYHHTTRRPAPRPHDAFHQPPNETSFSLPLPEDRSAIQHGIGEIMNALARNALDPRRAGLLLYALQVASMNLRTAHREDPKDKRIDTVEDITLDPVLGPLAPAAEIDENQHKGIMAQWLEEVERRLEEDEAAASLTLQASAAHYPTQKYRPIYSKSNTLHQSTPGEGTARQLPNHPSPATLEQLTFGCAVPMPLWLSFPQGICVLAAAYLRISNQEQRASSYPVVISTGADAVSAVERSAVCSLENSAYEKVNSYGEALMKSAFRKGHDFSRALSAASAPCPQHRPRTRPGAQPNPWTTPPLPSA